MATTWAGMFPVVPTPLDERERFDAAGQRALIEHYVAAGCHGAVVLGSGGEFPYFGFDERLEIAGAAVRAAAGRLPVMVGVGFCGLAEAARFIEAAQAVGVDGFLTALPTYYPIAFPDALAYYRRLDEVTHKPIFYYHFPQVTGNYFSAAQIGQVLRLKNIVGIKESSLNLAEMRAHLAAASRADFALFAGTSFLTTETLALGGKGVICPIPAVAPRLAVACRKAWLDGDRARAATLQDKLLDFIPLMNSFGPPVALQKLGIKLLARLPFSTRTGYKSRHAVIKEALRQLGLPITARVRSPLPQVTEAEKRGVEKLLKMVDLG